MLLEFVSAVLDAVTCAVVVQQAMARRNVVSVPSIVFRIRINVGDILIDGDDIFGDGVNVAARVESECDPGGVNLSANAFEQVRAKTSYENPQIETVRREAERAREGGRSVSW